jgi:hypothetical protein
MVWNTQDAEEQDERAAAAVTDRIKGRSVLLYLAAGLVMGPPLGFLVLFTIGATMIADFLFFWQKRQVVRKQLVSSMVPIVVHIVHRRMENLGSVRRSNKRYFVNYGYQMDKVSYVSKNEVQVSESLYERTTVIFKVSSTYPASGPTYSEKYLDQDDDLCSACVRCLFGAPQTAFVTFILGIIVGARTILGFFATATVMQLAGILIAARLDSRWRHDTLYACQVVDELPSSKMIDDKEDHNVGLEMGMLEDATETLALTEEYATLSLDETDLKIPTSSVI